MQPVRVNVAVLSIADPSAGRGNLAMENLVADRLAEAGHQIAAFEAVRDSEVAIRAQLVGWMADPDVDVVVVVGDGEATSSALQPLVDQTLPGFADLLRMLAYQEIGASAMLSAAQAARCGTTFVFVLPAHENAVKAAMEKLILPQLDPRTKPRNLIASMPRLRDAVEHDMTKVDVAKIGSGEITRVDNAKMESARVESARTDSVPTAIAPEKTQTGAGVQPKLPAGTAPAVGVHAAAAQRPRSRTGVNVIVRKVEDPTKPIELEELENQLALSKEDAPATADAAPPPRPNIATRPLDVGNLRAPAMPSGAAAPIAKPLPSIMAQRSAATTATPAGSHPAADSDVDHSVGDVTQPLDLTTPTAPVAPAVARTPTASRASSSEVGDTTKPLDLGRLPRVPPGASADALDRDDTEQILTPPPKAPAGGAGIARIQLKPVPSSAVKRGSPPAAGAGPTARGSAPRVDAVAARGDAAAAGGVATRGDAAPGNVAGGDAARRSDGAGTVAARGDVAGREVTAHGAAAGAVAAGGDTTPGNVAGDAAGVAARGDAAGGVAGRGDAAGRSDAVGGARGDVAGRTTAGGVAGDAAGGVTARGDAAGRTTAGGVAAAGDAAGGVAVRGDAAGRIDAAGSARGDAAGSEVAGGEVAGRTAAAGVAARGPAAGGVAARGDAAGPGDAAGRGGARGDAAGQGDAAGRGGARGDAAGRSDAAGSARGDAAGRGDATPPPLPIGTPIAALAAAAAADEAESVETLDLEPDPDSRTTIPLPEAASTTAAGATAAAATSASTPVVDATVADADEDPEVASSSLLAAPAPAKRKPTQPPPLTELLNVGPSSSELPRGQFVYPTKRASRVPLVIALLLLSAVIGGGAMYLLYGRGGGGGAQRVAQPPAVVDAAVADADGTTVASADIDAAEVEPEIEPEIEIDPTERGDANRPAPDRPVTRTVRRPTTEPRAGTAAETEEPAGTEKPAAPEKPAGPTAEPGCEEVACVLEKYARPCCARWRPQGETFVPASTENLSKPQIKAGVDKLRPRVIACGEKHPAKGTVKLSIRVDGEGDVKELSVLASPDPALGECIADALRKAKFDKTANGGAFSYPFVF